VHCYQWLPDDHPYYQTCPIHHPCQRSVWSSWTICCQSNTLKKKIIVEHVMDSGIFVFYHPKHITGSTFEPSIRTYSGLIYFCRCKPLYKSGAKLSQRSILGPLPFHMNTNNLPPNINSVATPVHYADTRKTMNEPDVGYRALLSNHTFHQQHKFCNCTTLIGIFWMWHTVLQITLGLAFYDVQHVSLWPVNFITIIWR